jgi:hypothetical protein
MTTETETPPVDETDDKDAATIWSEIEAEERSQDTDPPPSDKGRDEDPPADPDPQDDFKPEPEGEGGKDEPKGADDGNKTEPAADDGAAPQQENDLWAKAPKELREQYEAAQQRAAMLELQFNRERGRTSTLTKKLNEIERPPTPAKEPADRKADLAKLREEYPEVAEPLLEELDDLKGVLRTLTAAEQERQSAVVEAQAAEVRKLHPDYQDVIVKHADTFAAWVEDPRHPRWVKDAFERNRENIVNAREVIPIVTEFKKFMKLPVPGAQQPPAQAQSAPQGTPQPSLSDKRQRQLQGSIAPSLRTQPAATSGTIPEEGDAQAIWDAIEREERRRAR